LIVELVNMGQLYDRVHWIGLWAELMGGVFGPTLRFRFMGRLY